MLSHPRWKHPGAIGFFFGAGASIEFGIPSMKQLTDSFSERIQQNKSLLKKREMFADIYNSLADKVDLEAIMSVIVGLKEENRVRDNIGEETYDLHNTAIKYLLLYFGSNERRRIMPY
jgi:predicted CopG family antitoxin